MKFDGKTYTKINDLVGKGNYLSVENFVEVAVKNQLSLELAGKSEAKRFRSQQKPVRTDQSKFSTLLGKPEKVLTETHVSKTLDDKIRNSPIWGQINRLVPVKFVMRILVNNLIDSEETSVDLKRFNADVAQMATEFRRFAKRMDKKQRIRGEEIYVGFSKKTPSSQQRFLNYYVGKGPLKKWTDSILTGLSLASIEEFEDGTTVIEPTENGLKLALMHSPIIDDFFLDKKQIDAPFSEEEVSFLISQIRSTRPGELEFLSFTLRAIKKGADTPAKLRNEVFSFLAQKDLEIKTSEKIINTMQIGVIGRLVEMRLLKIEKKAQKSRYIVTSKGEKIIE